MTSTSRVLVVGERFNIGERWSHCEGLLRDGKLERWLRTSLSLGAFGAGMTELSQLGSTGRKKLLSVGLPESFEALNLLPPGECGEWQAHDAKLVADELRRIIVRERMVSNAERSLVERGVDMVSSACDDRWLFDRVVLLGNRVAEAMDHRAEFFVAVGGAMKLPHPSGRCLWWNSKLDVDMMRPRVQEFLA